MPTPTLRSLAKTLNLSRTTISDALRGSPRVKTETIARVTRAAAAAGYRRNPLTGTVMSHLRRSGGLNFRGVIAAIDIIPENRSAYAQLYSDAIFAGVEERAGDLGFRAEKFTVTKGLTLKRLDTIMFTRGIQALVVLPLANRPDLSDLKWHRYTSVYVDYDIDQPRLHSVCSDHYRSMVSLLRELHERGYRRPGLIMEVLLDERLHFRWEGAFYALSNYLPNITEIPPLRVNELTENTFRSWFTKHQPDVVIGHYAHVLEWMINAGARIPEKHGYACLNAIRAPHGSCRLDLQPMQLGARATELVTAQLLQNKMGPPQQPSLTSIPAQFFEGTTIRSRPANASNSDGRRNRVCDEPRQ